MPKYTIVAADEEKKILAWVRSGVGLRTSLEVVITPRQTETLASQPSAVYKPEISI